ncbi:hypothetical protein FRC11_008443 [Ceratobasidium sp. 423]|nr:hypothetical protein FRC11_008443 [Ceratobasidium sp. 423]
MSVDLEALNMRAWVVDSKRRPLPFFNLRRIAPDAIESWIPAVSGEGFAIYFNGRNQSPEQKMLDIHAIAEFDGLRKLDGVILPSAQRAQGYVGGILDQPAREGKARPLKWGRLRLIEWLENHTWFLPSSEPRLMTNASPARECPQQHSQLEGGLHVQRTNNLPISSSLPEREPRLLDQGHDEGPMVVQIKLEPDISVRAVSDLFTRTNNPRDKRILKRKYQSRPVFSSRLKQEDSKSAVLQPIHTVQTGGNTPNEPIVISSDSDTEESSDGDIQLIKQVVFNKNEKKKKEHGGVSKESGVKKRLKSEEYIGPVVGAGAPGSRWDDEGDIMNIKTEPTD